MGIWAKAGKPDFAKCAEFISRFDPELRESLNRSDAKAMQWTLFFMWQQESKPGGIGSYCTFALQKVGAAFKRSRWTVRRALGRLENLGLISVLHRRPLTPGNWQTNLYRMTPKLKAILWRILSGGVKILSSSKSAPQEFRKKTLRKDDAPRNASSSFQKTQNNDEARPQHVFTDGWGAQEEQWTAERANPEQARAGFAKLKAVLAATLGKTRRAAPVLPSAG